MAEKPEKKKRMDPAEFKRGLLEACEQQIKTGRDHVRVFFCNNGDRVPEEYEGDKDRSNGFYWSTTIVKTLGKEGLDVIQRMYPYEDQLDTICHVALGKTLDEVDPEFMARCKARQLANSCVATISVLDAMMKYEKNSIMQHTLNSLRAELQWAYREYSGENKCTVSGGVVNIKADFTKEDPVRKHGTYGEKVTFDDAKVTVTEFLDDFYDEGEDNYNQAFGELERRLQEYFEYEHRDTENEDKDEKKK